MVKEQKIKHSSKNCKLFYKVRKKFKPLKNLDYRRLFLFYTEEKKVMLVNINSGSDLECYYFVSSFFSPRPLLSWPTENYRRLC